MARKNTPGLPALGFILFFTAFYLFAKHNTEALFQELLTRQKTASVFHVYVGRTDKGSQPVEFKFDYNNETIEASQKISLDTFRRYKNNIKCSTMVVFDSLHPRNCELIYSPTQAERFHIQPTPFTETAF